MTIDFPKEEQIPQLRTLWQEAFGDEDAYLDQFQETGFSPERCRCVTCDGQIAAALYWFPCFCRGKQIAYLYAVATKKGFRHQGLCLRLLEDTHACLQEQGYAGAILMPANEGLYFLYEKAGYKPATQIGEFSCKAQGEPVQIQKISGEDYDSLRALYLPAGSVIQGDAAIAFLETQAEFYQGDGFLLCGCADGTHLQVQEYLGKKELAPRILRALHLEEGLFRGPGAERMFTMYLPLTPEGREFPTYFGLPLD